MKAVCACLVDQPRTGTRRNAHGPGSRRKRSRRDDEEPSSLVMHPQLRLQEITRRRDANRSRPLLTSTNSISRASISVHFLVPSRCRCKADCLPPTSSTKSGRCRLKSATREKCGKKVGEPLEWFGQTFCRRYPIGGHEFGSSSGICQTSLTMWAVSDWLASAPRRHQKVSQIDARNIEFVDVSNGRDR